MQSFHKDIFPKIYFLFFFWIFSSYFCGAKIWS